MEDESARLWFAMGKDVWAGQGRAGRLDISRGRNSGAVASLPVGTFFTRGFRKAVQRGGTFRGHYSTFERSLGWQGGYHAHVGLKICEMAEMAAAPRGVM